MTFLIVTLALGLVALSALVVFLVLIQPPRCGVTVPAGELGGRDSGCIKERTLSLRLWTGFAIYALIALVVFTAAVLRHQ
jgi:hypothetical protein